MKVFEIVDYCGNIIECIKANNEKHALCIYLANHEELTDAMLWKSPYEMWKLAEYNLEEFYIFAREV